MINSQRYMVLNPKDGNPQIHTIYKEFFGKPLSPESHHLLHTDHKYRVVDQLEF